MTSRGFVFLLVVTVAAIGVAARIAETYTSPGMERTIAVAIMTALALWPAAKFAERRGWVKGELQLGRPRASATGPGVSGSAGADNHGSAR
jgi:hypothetical protein